MLSSLHLHYWLTQLYDTRTFSFCWCTHFHKTSYRKRLQLFNVFRRWMMERLRSVDSSELFTGLWNLDLCLDYCTLLPFLSIGSRYPLWHRVAQVMKQDFDLCTSAFFIVLNSSNIKINLSKKGSVGGQYECKIFDTGSNFLQWTLFVSIAFGEVLCFLQEGDLLPKEKRCSKEN